MEDYEVQEKEGGDEPKKQKKLKVGSSLAGGCIFGLTAGLIMVVILSLFPQNGGAADFSQTAGPAIEAQETDKGDSYEETETGDLEIKTVARTEENQTVVTDVTQVVDNVMPCVVSIFSTYVIEDNFWGYYYDYEAEGGGSGIIIGENDTELLIVTNNHVVEDSKELTVQFIDDSVAMAAIKGTDEKMDLAVISVDVSELDPATKTAIRIATLGNSDILKVGEPAIAIGNALGYGQSVTTGVISAVNRSYTDEYGPLYKGSMDDEDMEDVKFLIQTDAAISPGNSGGALLNVRGEVVGINSSKIADYTIEGMGYAIPISTAKPIIQELMEKKGRPVGKAESTAYLGISGMAVTGELLERYDLSKGIYITKVFPDTPAKKAGIKKGDILLSVDDYEVGDMEDLSKALSYYEEGAEVTVKILKRSNSGYLSEELTVVLGGKR